MNRLLLAMTALVPAAALAVTPVNGPAPTLTPVTINNGPGDQNDPHVSGDWAAYASDVSIRYYRFSTNADAQIPMGSSARDLLSDISGNRVVFSRIITGVKTAVMVFDTTTAGPAIEVDPAAATTRLGSAIGGNTVAYIDSGLEGSGELVIHDLVSSTSVRITNDVRPDQNPSVSPDGKVVTWEHCMSSLSNCDVWQAVNTGSGWVVTETVSTTNPEANPDTNGSLVVYDSLRGGNSDLYWRPVGGGTEVQLQMPGVEANPSIAGNFIAFESRPTLFSTSDIFVYDMAANMLYQITNTALVTEQLNDITVLPDGRVRVVWASDEDGYNQRNVKGATFSLGGVPVPPPTGGSVAICHRPPGNPNNAHTINVGERAVPAHLAHGDSRGACDDSGSQHGALEGSAATGCSSTGGAPTVFMLLGVAAWILISRRQAVHASARSRR